MARAAFHHTPAFILEGIRNGGAMKKGWGTTDNAALEAQIWDFADDIFLGDAVIVPVLGAPDPQRRPAVERP